MNERDHKIAALKARTGIDEPMIEQVVRSFYARIRADALLGPVFEDRILEWEPHLQRMFAFWSSVALMSGRYHGRPMEKHERLPIDHRHFNRWIAVFEETVGELCPPAAADTFVTLARRIAVSLEASVATRCGHLPVAGQRLKRPDDEVFLPARSINDGEHLV